MTAVCHRSQAAPTAATLAAIVAATRPGDPRDEQLLRDHVAAYAWSAHLEQVPPQHFLVHVKETFRGARCAHLTAQQVEILLDRAITWAIRGYYGRDPGTPPPGGRAAG